MQISKNRAIMIPQCLLDRKLASLRQGKENRTVRILFVTAVYYEMIGVRFLRGKKVICCTVCGRELRHKYKPSKSWNIEGFLCADCHIEKTKEFTLKEQEPVPETCALCNTEIQDGAAKKAKWQWNLDAGAIVCPSCFDRKDKEFDKRINYCAVCGVKMGIIRYNPKPLWNIDGQICRRCWDIRNGNQVTQ